MDLRSTKINLDIKGQSMKALAWESIVSNGRIIFLLSRKLSPLQKWVVRQALLNVRISKRLQIDESFSQKPQAINRRSLVFCLFSDV